MWIAPFKCSSASSTRCSARTFSVSDRPFFMSVAGDFMDMFRVHSGKWPLNAGNAENAERHREVGVKEERFIQNAQNTQKTRAAPNLASSAKILVEKIMKSNGPTTQETVELKKEVKEYFNDETTMKDTLMSILDIYTNGKTDAERINALTKLCSFFKLGWEIVSNWRECRENSQDITIEVIRASLKAFFEENEGQKEEGDGSEKSHELPDHK